LGEILDDAFGIGRLIRQRSAERVAQLVHGGLWEDGTVLDRVEEVGRELCCPLQ
jgi:hypothetical protein